MFEDFKSCMREVKGLVDQKKGTWKIFTKKNFFWKKNKIKIYPKKFTRKWFHRNKKKSEKIYKKNIIWKNFPETNFSRKKITKKNSPIKTFKKNISETKFNKTKN